MLPVLEDVIDPPDLSHAQPAFDQLHRMNYIDMPDDDGELTEEGMFNQSIRATAGISFASKRASHRRSPSLNTKIPPPVVAIILHLLLNALYGHIYTFIIPAIHMYTPHVHPYIHLTHLSIHP